MIPLRIYYFFIKQKVKKKDTQVINIMLQSIGTPN